MSYCRWSSDNWHCDLYCYSDVSGGYTTYVAANRIAGDIPLVTARLDTETDAFTVQYAAQMAWLKTCEREPIGLAHDGERYNDATLEAFRERLIGLRAEGYSFPDYVLNEIDEEITADSEAGNGR